MCAPTFTFFGGNGYLLSFPQTCIGSPSQFRARVEYHFVPQSGHSDVDKVPNSSTTPNVTFAA